MTPELHRLPRNATLLAAFLLSAASVGCSEDLPKPDPELHRAEVEAWHERRLDALREPEGWLTVIGLSWLEQGENPFGSDASNFVILPGDEVPPRAGVFTLRGDVVQMQVEPGVPITHQGEVVESLILSSDATGRPAKVWMGSLVWQVIQRQDLVGIRVRDTANAARFEFESVETFPVSQEWLIPARFDRYLLPRTLNVPNVLGMITEQASPGAVEFEVGGEKLSLAVTGDPEGRSFSIVFGDQTNGAETYGGGRFLSVDVPDEEGRTFIDFNKAYNPPCVFTAFATCPLPVPQNILPVRIEAGEKNYHH